MNHLVTTYLDILRATTLVRNGRAPGVRRGSPAGAATYYLLATALSIGRKSGSPSCKARGALTIQKKRIPGNV